MRPVSGAEITVINPSPKAPYTGMLPGFVAGHYALHDLEIDLRRLARNAGAQLITGSAIGLDPKRKIIKLPDRPDISYDLASIDIGVTSALLKVNGFAANGIPAKPLGAFALAWECFLSDALPRHKSVTVIGGGVGGVELALAMAYRLDGLAFRYKVTLLHNKETLLPGVSPRTRQKLEQELKAQDIDVLLSTQVKSIGAKEITTNGNQIIPSDFTVSSAGATPHAWLTTTGLNLTNGFINVDETLLSSDPNIFATGDCAHLTFSPRPKAGVFAVRQAPILHHNIKASLTGAPLRRYRPQKNYLKLISTGGKSAVADTFGASIGGAWLWKLKDRIDRKFMAKLSDFPTMRPPTATNDAAEGTKELQARFEKMCAGCGAKVDAGNLNKVLNLLPHAQRTEVISSPGDDAAILAQQDGYQVLTTDHLRGFTNDGWLMGKVAAIHALGDIWAMGAEPQAALSTIILPPMATHLETELLSNILIGATEEIRKAGADIVGGHTTVGTELTVGFSLTGIRAQMPITHNGARPGDKIILTKPIGTGTILAAEMQGLADGHWVENTYKIMTTSSAKAANLLAPVATAMTDVTGFGLAGHLNQVMRSSKVSARIQVSAIPFLDGAIELTKDGIRSSLWPGNRKIIDQELPTTPEFALLFDPQTAGGLLATVPQENAAEILKELRKNYSAAIIGEIIQGPGQIDFVD